ncbi:methionyl-tRNA formyltransferase, mitochondrial [Bradysia coprophila]|uniref:methionyl-tRNA formyltransferase, mitochondrial n=1 Tax=Bradysia coprophila TaxID=38358 RepID=UPI00187D99DC|nr:methionyl-tRNA formyltransferase, mitochondrial [Bradysia coprophila]
MNFVHNTGLFFKSIFKCNRNQKYLYETSIKSRNFQSNPTRSIDVLFFGTDKFSLASLRALVNEQKHSRTVRKLAVVTSFKNSSNPVKKLACAENLDCFDWPISSDVCKKYDLGVVVSFGHLIPASIISSLPYGMINVHGSLLPRWRGAAPIIYAILNGDTCTGITIMRILPKHFDIGEIIAQQEVPISKDCLMPELHDTMSNVGADLLIKCLPDIESRLKNASQQNPDHVTYAPKVMPELAQVNWNSSALEIYNLYRALYSFKPLATRWNDRQVRITKMMYSSSDAVSTRPPGSVEYNKLDKYLKVICGNGCSVRVLNLGLEGKKVMSANEFYNGFLSKVKDKSYFV